MLDNIDLKKLNKFINFKIQLLEKLNYATNIPKFSKIRYFGGGFLTHLVLIYLKKNYPDRYKFDLNQYDGDLDLFYQDSQQITSFLNFNKIEYNKKMSISMAARFNSEQKHLFSLFKNNEIRLNFSSRKECSDIDLFLDFDLNYSMVLFDLKKKQLVYNIFFKEFLNNLKIKIINFHTPIKSYARCLHKTARFNFLKFNQIDHLSLINQLNYQRKCSMDSLLKFPDWIINDLKEKFNYTLNDYEEFFSNNISDTNFIALPDTLLEYQDSESYSLANSYDSNYYSIYFLKYKHFSKLCSKMICHGNIVSPQSLMRHDFFNLFPEFISQNPIEITKHFRKNLKIEKKSLGPKRA